MLALILCAVRLTVVIAASAALAAMSMAAESMIHSVAL
jgi:hypothetical protein